MTEQKEKKSKIPYIFVAFFAVIFAVDAFFIYLSKATWRGLATENSYEKGLHYNQTLAEAKKQEALGWKMTISFTSLSNDSGNVFITLKDKDLKPITDAKISIEVKRPVQEGFDFNQDVAFKGGLYEAKMTFPLPGQWDFLVTAQKGEDIFRAAKRYVVQKKKPL